jgi:Uma2 family endonuclease
MQVALKQLVVSPGHQLLIKDVSWEMYEEILNDLGESRRSRINYSRGILEIMAPLPEHEDDKVIIGDFVKVFLEELDKEFRSLGSTTFKSQEMEEGIEADDCFYIENEAKIRGKKRLDLTVDPPPDLAIEIDLTSRTKLNNYRRLGVKELWRFNGKKLEINLLRNGEYIESKISPNLGNLPLAEVIPEYLATSKSEGRNSTMKKFRSWVKDEIKRIL